MSGNQDTSVMLVLSSQFRQGNKGRWCDWSPLMSLWSLKAAAGILAVFHQTICSARGLLWIKLLRISSQATVDELCFPKHSGLSYLMALFHCMVRHGTVRYGSLLGGFPLGTVPGTWYFFSTTSVEVPSSRTVTKTWRVNSADHWMAGENRHYCVTELATRDPPLPLYPLDLNQHSQRRIGRNFCLNKRTFLHQPQNSSVVVCWGSSDVPLVDSRGADKARAWWRDAEGKALCI